jgi:hypothetical protein
MTASDRGDSTGARRSAVPNQEADASHAAPRVWLDHFLVAIDDLDTGVADFEAATGVRPAFGGEHPTLGTHNALVSLGAPAYLEILAPRPGATLASMVEGVSRHGTLTPYLWALATDDLSGLHRALSGAGFGAGEPSPGSRVTRDGLTLSWSMFMLEAGPDGAPFFIQWARATRHPSTSAPAGCSLEAFAVASRDEGELRRLLELIRFPATVLPASSLSSIRLRTPLGAVTIGG